tara:strand:+ start:530 stop:802 length:273 start_codon:yes stop_codon:yes gene_type:complete
MNIKNNQINQIKNELNEIKVDAKTLNLSEQLDEVENNTVVLTDIVKNSENLSNFLSNSEIIVKLKQLEENVNNQQEILMHLIENLEKKNN